MIYSNKALDAIIVIGTALSDIATKSSAFKSNLKGLSEQKAELDKASAALKEEHDANTLILDETKSKLSKLDMKENKVERKIAVSTEALADLKVTKQVNADATARNAEKEKELKEAEKDLINQTDQFKKYYDSKTAELLTRETKLKVAENHIKEVQNVMKR